MSCTLAEARQIARRIQEHWGCHLYLRVVPHAVPSMDWREVILPSSFESWSPAVLWQTLLHEWGHRTVSPISPRRAKLWRRLCEREGLSERQGQSVGNIAADAWVDTWHVQAPEWRAVYAEGMRESLGRYETEHGLATLEAGEKPAKRFARLYGAFYRRLIERFAPPAPPSPATGLDPEVEAAAARGVSLLFDEAGSVDERVQALGRHLKSWLPPDPVVLVVTGLPLSGNEKGRPGGRWRDADLVVLDAGRRAGFDEGDFESVFDPEELAALRRRAERLRIYARVAPLVRSFLRRRSRVAFTGFRPWTVGRPLRELDVVATLQRSPRLLPNVNTLARRFERRGTSYERGAGAVVIVLDDSGSTEGAVLEREKEAAFSVVATARACGDEVGCVAFGSEVTLSLPLTSHHVRVEEAICGLGSTSGGTSLVPALREAARHVRKLDAFTILVMTDSEIADTDELETFLRGLPTGSRVVAFCFGETESIRRNFGRLAGRRFHVLAASAEKPFAEAALQEVYG
jgi:Mg-chelatase subunit ChlD